MRSLEEFAPEAGHAVHPGDVPDALTEFETEASLGPSACSPVPGGSPAPALTLALRLAEGRSNWIAAVAVTIVLVTMAALRPAAVAVPRPTPRSTVAPAATMASAATSQLRALPALGGSWRLTSRVAETDLPRYRGLVLGYQLTLHQDGTRLRGEGVKWTENGRPLSRAARTPIALEGTIDDGSLRLVFTESGLRRTSRGAFTLQLVGDGSMSGSFRSDAASSSGTVTVMRAN